MSHRWFWLNSWSHRIALVKLLAIQMALVKLLVTQTMVYDHGKLMITVQNIQTWMQKSDLCSVESGQVRKEVGPR